MKIFNCVDLDKAGYGKGRFCCNSCHDDEEMGYEMCGRSLDNNGHYYLEICCEKSMTIEKISDKELLEALLSKNIKKE